MSMKGNNFLTGLYFRYLRIMIPITKREIIKMNPSVKGGLTNGPKKKTNIRR
jgi:hypothetical protein